MVRSWQFQGLVGHRGSVSGTETRCCLPGGSLSTVYMDWVEQKCSVLNQSRDELWKTTCFIKCSSEVGCQIFCCFNDALLTTIRCYLPTCSGAGTSGGELEEESWQPPDAELIQKLVAQIEYYLSDENLEHDAFLLKHVRRNKLGFVSVKLLTSFKKVNLNAKKKR